jgi:hypothetical protein
MDEKVEDNKNQFLKCCFKQISCTIVWALNPLVNIEHFDLDYTCVTMICLPTTVAFTALIENIHMHFQFQ